jgi:isopenicillin-N epimerase
MTASVPERGPWTFVTDTPEEFGRDARRHWWLDPDCIFLNHGSFGATPRDVMAAQEEWRIRMEREPVHFMSRTLPGALRDAADELAGFLGADGDDLVFVENATAGVNTVLRSLRWNPGDEVVFTSHGYGAVNRAIRFTAERHGARPVETAIPFPIECEEQVVAAVEAALSSRTRLVVLDHVTSCSALVLPLARLVERCHNRNVPVLVDGAHAPGMLPVDLETLGADYYAGNCHKWLCGPKGCGFLWAAPERQADLHPLVISWGWPDGFQAEFAWTGTRDPSPWLAVSAALAFFRRIPPARRWDHNNRLAAWASALLEEAWQTAPSAPRAMRASMATVAVPGRWPATKAMADRLHDDLLQRFAIEVPVMEFGGRLWIRVCAQVYNESWEYERLAEAVLRILGNAPDERGASG